MDASDLADRDRYGLFRELPGRLKMRCALICAATRSVDRVLAVASLEGVDSAGELRDTPGPGGLSGRASEQDRCSCVLTNFSSSVVRTSMRRPIRTIVNWPAFQARTRVLRCTLKRSAASFRLNSR